MEESVYQPGAVDNHNRTAGFRPAWAVVHANSPWLRQHAYEMSKSKPNAVPVWGLAVIKIHLLSKR